VPHFNGASTASQNLTQPLGPGDVFLFGTCNLPNAYCVGDTFIQLVNASTGVVIQSGTQCANGCSFLSYSAQTNQTVTVVLTCLSGVCQAQAQYSVTLGSSGGSGGGNMAVIGIAAGAAAGGAVLIVVVVLVAVFTSRRKKGGSRRQQQRRVYPLGSNET
jgi:hypothetical protein